jgi:hypothetical protein
MSHLAELPERGEDPVSLISLSEMFRAKAYAAEIKRALKKGYTFDDLAEIFSERCGIVVSARQLRYHYTREKNRRSKNSIGEKPKPSDTPNDRATSENPAGANSNDVPERDVIDTEAAANVPAIYAPEPSVFVAANAEVGSAETGAFFFEKRV